MSVEQIKSFARETGKTVLEAIVLSPQNDPFYAGGDASKAAGEWFAELWRGLGFEKGVHVRRIHYKLISLETPATMPNDKTYENTQTCWLYLNGAARAARYLGLVDARDFVDRRNPDPVINQEYVWRSEPSYTLQFPMLVVRDRADTGLSEAKSEIDGYEYDSSLEKYHLEVWIEKSTMDDELKPLCEELAVNYVPGLGFESITQVIDLLFRVARSGKPARIFYISDFDPGGAGMPVQFSRQIEYWKSFYDLQVDIKVMILALTKEQVEKYNLPGIPIKETDRRKAAFEKRHGAESACELDALEALHPGELATIVREAIAPYRDPNFKDSLEDAEWKATKAVEKWLEDVLAPFEKDLEDIKAKAEALSQKYTKSMQPLRKRFETIYQAIRTRAEETESESPPPVPDRPEPDVDGDPDEVDWLYDSSRSYGDQLACYKKYQYGGEEGGEE